MMTVNLRACGLGGDLDALGLHNLPELYVSARQAQHSTACFAHGWQRSAGCLVTTTSCCS